MAVKTNPVPIERIERSILLLRGHKVILDADLAALYGVATKRLNEQVRRNISRFPPDFMFTLTSKEKAEVVANCDHLRKLRFSPTLPRAFTEHGAIMVASVLNTARAVEVSIYVVRAFVRLRELLATHRQLAQKLAELEQQLVGHDKQIRTLFDAIRELMRSPSPKKRRIGFIVSDKAAKYGR
jgi:hypothetical protein